MRVLRTACLEVAFITHPAMNKLAVSLSRLKHWRAAAACSEKRKNQKRLPSYSMNTNMLPSIGQPNRVISRNACHETCMSRMCCFEVASGSCSLRSLACCRRLEHGDLYILFARPPAAASISLTRLADAAVWRDFFSVHRTKSMAVYSLLLL